VEAIVFRSWEPGWLRIAEQPDWRALERPTVFLDTTIPSYVVAGPSRDPVIARRQRITRVWWSRYRRHYELLISDRVLKEASAGASAQARARMSLTESVRTLVCEPHHVALAQELLRPGCLPLKAHVDAAHIATAAYHSVRFLLTWNCKHLANPMIARKVAQTCEAHDLDCPLICTPETLMRIFRP
jgi:hypothetical protein